MNKEKAKRYAMDIVLRLSGLLWSEFGGNSNSWDELALQLLKKTSRQKKQAMAVYFMNNIPLGLAEKVWTFINKERDCFDQRASSGSVPGGVGMFPKRDD